MSFSPFTKYQKAVQLMGKPPLAPTSPASLTRVKKKKEKKPLSIHFCWLDVGVESGPNQRRLSLSWKLFIFQKLPKGFEQN